MEDKKTKAKIISKPIKKNCKKDHENIIEIFLKLRKLKKEIILTLEPKICQTHIEKKQNVHKIITIKEKDVQLHN